MTAGLGRLIPRRVRHAIKSAAWHTPWAFSGERLTRRHQWSIAMYEGPTPFDLAPMKGVPTPVLTRADVQDFRADLVADPFLHRSGAGWHLFFEVLPVLGSTGQIAYAESSDGRSWRYGGVCLQEEFHLSYPYVFSWDGETFMIPESTTAGQVRLYRATDYPAHWELHSILLEGGAFQDPSIFQHGERWWLFVSPGDPRSDTLELYGAERLLGPWRAHPRSPVVRGDPSAARPAGRVITVEGRPTRFAQDNTVEYGTAVHAFEIVRLSPDEYEERRVPGGPVVQRSGRGWNASGMHHVDPHLVGGGGWVASVDGRPWLTARDLLEAVVRRSR